MNLKAAFQKYAQGDSVTDEELDAMIASAESALPYLQARPDYGIASSATARDLEMLKSFRRERGRR